MGNVLCVVLKLRGDCMRVSDVAEVLKLGVWAVYKLMDNKQIPKPSKDDVGHFCWDKKDIDEWLGIDTARDEMVTLEEVAEMFGWHIYAASKNVRKQPFPASVAINARYKLWRLSEIMRHMEQTKVTAFEARNDEDARLLCV